MYYFFFAPLGTELKVRRFPVGVLCLSAINVLYFLLFRYSPGVGARAGALAFDTGHPSLITAFTACFLHADWFHLIGNLVYLLTFGPALEDRLTGPTFLLLYLGCGVGAMLIQFGLNAAHLPGESGAVVMGASGAISGILGLFAVRCGFARVRIAHVTMALVQGQTRAGTSRVNGGLAVGFWFLLQLIYGLVSSHMSGGVAYGTHLGGVVLGVTSGLFLGLHRKARIEYIWIRSRRYADSGQWFAALGETIKYLKQVPQDIDAWLQLGRMNRILRRPAESINAYQKSIDLLWQERRRHEAVRAARELRRHYPQSRLRPALLYRLGLHLERHGDLGWASHTLEDYAAYYPDHQNAPGALLRAADIEARLRNNLSRARELYEAVMDHFPQSEEAKKAEQGMESVERVLARRRETVFESGEKSA